MSDIVTAVTRKLNPYDSALEDNIHMYDNLPYQRDPDLCNKDSLRLVSGNVMKFYRCKISEPYLVSNMDDIIEYRIAEALSASTPEYIEPEALPAEDSEELLAQALTSDNGTQSLPEEADVSE